MLSYTRLDKMEQEDFYWVWLTCVNGVGPVKAHKLLEKYKTAKIKLLVAPTVNKL